MSPRSTRHEFHECRLQHQNSNNVNLSEDRQVLKALEGWHPGYMDWWGDMARKASSSRWCILRTAYSVDPRGWASSITSEPEYRWGILLARRKRTASFLRRKLRQAAWQEVPGEHRATLRRLIVIQGDT